MSHFSDDQDYASTHAYVEVRRLHAPSPALVAYRFLVQCSCEHCKGRPLLCFMLQN